MVVPRLVSYPPVRDLHGEKAAWGQRPRRGEDAADPTVKSPSPPPSPDKHLSIAELETWLRGAARAQAHAHLAAVLASLGLDFPPTPPQESVSYPPS